MTRASGVELPVMEMSCVGIVVVIATIGRKSLTWIIHRWRGFCCNVLLFWYLRHFYEKQSVISAD